jgi:hypothetical protein
VKGPRVKQSPGPDPFEPRRLKGGRNIGCRHLTEDGRTVGFDPKRAQKARSPAAGLTAHHHDFN